MKAKAVNPRTSFVAPRGQPRSLRSAFPGGGAKQCSAHKGLWSLQPVSAARGVLVTQLLPSWSLQPGVLGATKEVLGPGFLGFLGFPRLSSSIRISARDFLLGSYETLLWSCFGFCFGFGFGPRRSPCRSKINPRSNQNRIESKANQNPSRILIGSLGNPDTRIGNPRTS